MAKSTYSQVQYSSRDMVESAGAILFDFRDTGITLLQLLHGEFRTGTEAPMTANKREPKIAVFFSGERNQTLLPKGRRNIDEPREVAAIRETYEETGLRCQLLPITLHTRATSVNPTQDRVNSGGYTLNEVRKFIRTTDPFFMTLRKSIDRDRLSHVKLIWWYVAVVDEAQDDQPIQLDPTCELRLVPVSQAAAACTFEDDRKILREAVSVVEETLGISWGNK